MSRIVESLMLPNRESAPRVRPSFVASVTLLLCVFLSVPVLAVDAVVLTDGSEYEGTVISLDKDRLIFDLFDGTRKKFPRRDLSAIYFSEEEKPKPIDVKVRVLAEDDEVMIFLNEEPIATAAELTSSWISIGERLGEGSNRIRAEVQNKTSFWAYRWVIEAGGERYTFSCGLPRKSGCTQDGASGNEKGTMPAGAGWIYVHRNDGSVEVVAD